MTLAPDSVCTVPTWTESHNILLSRRHHAFTIVHTHLGDGRFQRQCRQLGQTGSANVFRCYRSHVKRSTPHTVDRPTRLWYGLIEFRWQRILAVERHLMLKRGFLFGNRWHFSGQWTGRGRRHQRIQCNQEVCRSSTYTDDWQKMAIYVHGTGRFPPDRHLYVEFIVCRGHGFDGPNIRMQDIGQWTAQNFFLCENHNENTLESMTFRDEERERKRRDTYYFNVE